jgi:hypothetical protein
MKGIRNFEAPTRLYLGPSLTAAATGLGSRILQPAGSRAGIAIGRWTDPREPSEADGREGDGGKKI